MASFLFLTWNGGGATVPILAIGRELIQQGHAVRVLGHQQQTEQFAKARVPFARYPRAGDLAVGASPLHLLRLMRSRATAVDVVEELDARPVDLVVVDPLLLSALQKLRARYQPYALLEPTTDTLMRGRLLTLGPLLRLLGLQVRKLLSGANSVVVASVQELDPRAGLDAEHIGPMIHAVPAQPSEPMVLMSLSTFPFPRLTRTWQRLLDAADGLPARVIATTGPSLDPAELPAPSNVELLAWADHAELMPTTSAVVTHGGHGTTIAALAHGLPVLVIPLDPSSDQSGIGRIVERLGVGIALPRGSRPERIRAALVRLLHDEELRRRANDLGARIREYGGSQAGAAALVRAIEPDRSAESETTE